MTLNKVVDTAAAAVSEIADGSSLAVGGFGLAGVPWILTQSTIRTRGPRSDRGVQQLRR